MNMDFSNEEVMRSLKVRAKRLDNNKWVEGYIYEHEPPLQAWDAGQPDIPSRWFVMFTAYADWNMIRGINAVEVIPESMEKIKSTPELEIDTRNKLLEDR